MRDALVYPPVPGCPQRDDAPELQKAIDADEQQSNREALAEALFGGEPIQDAREPADKAAKEAEEARDWFRKVMSL